MPDGEKLTASLRLIGADDDDELRCGRCGGPAVFVNSSTGNRICLSCVLHPPQYGPDYAWQGHRSDATITAGRVQCRARSPHGGWMCTLYPADHPHLHEAWGGGSPNPIMAWTRENVLVFVDRSGWILQSPPIGGWQGRAWTDADRRGWCNARRDSPTHGMRIVCTLAASHEGMHEGWRAAREYSRRTEPVMAWSRDGLTYWEAASAR